METKKVEIYFQQKNIAIVTNTGEHGHYSIQLAKSKDEDYLINFYVKDGELQKVEDEAGHDVVLILLRVKKENETMADVLKTFVKEGLVVNNNGMIYEIVVRESDEYGNSVLITLDGIVLVGMYNHIKIK